MSASSLPCCACLDGFAPLAAAEDIGDQIEGGIGKAEDLMKIYDSWQEFAAAHDALTPDDRQFDPDYEPPGSPKIPSACAGRRNATHATRKR